MKRPSSVSCSGIIKYPTPLHSLQTSGSDAITLVAANNTTFQESVSELGSRRFKYFLQKLEGSLGLTIYPVAAHLEKGKKDSPRRIESHHCVELILFLKVFTSMEGTRISALAAVLSVTLFPSREVTTM